MPGTIAGGKAAAKTNSQKTSVKINGEIVNIEPGTMYQVIGAIGGKKGKTGGFWANRELARIAGAKGGRISRRTKSTARES